MALDSNSMAGPPTNPRSAGWEHFPHDADVGIRGFGPTKAAAFEQAAYALVAVVTAPERVEARSTVEIDCCSVDDELLLAAWLNALVYEMATRQMLFARFELQLADGRLRCRALGEPIDVDRHELRTEVKGATLTALEVARRPDGRWIAQCVVDV